MKKNRQLYLTNIKIIKIEIGLKNYHFGFVRICFPSLRPLRSRRTFRTYLSAPGPSFGRLLRHTRCIAHDNWESSRPEKKWRFNVRYFFRGCVFLLIHFLFLYILHVFYTSDLSIDFRCVLRSSLDTSF